MSANPIYIWLASDAPRQPESIEDVGPIFMDLLERSRDLTNVPKNPERLAAFSSLAEYLQRQFSSAENSDDEAPWNRDLLRDANATKGLVFALEPPSDAVPPEQLMMVFAKQAKKLGLVVFYHDTDTCFLSDGRVVPEEVKNALEYADARPKRLSAREILELLQAAIDPAFRGRSFLFDTAERDPGNTLETWQFRRKWGDTEQLFRLRVSSSEPASADLRAHVVFAVPGENGSEFDWNAGSRGQFFLDWGKAWPVFTGREQDRLRMSLEEPDERALFVRFMRERYLPIFDSIKDCESFNLANANLHPQYNGIGQLFHSSNLVAAWLVRNAMYLQEIQRLGRGSQSLFGPWYCEAVVSWIVEQQTSNVRADGHIDLIGRAKLQRHRYPLDHTFRLTEVERAKITGHLNALESLLAKNAISRPFKMLPIDPDEPLVRRWSRKVGSIRQELRLGLGWRFGQYVDSVLCYFYSDEMEQGFERLGLKPRGQYLGYTSITAVVPKQVFEEEGCYTKQRFGPEIFHGLIRPEGIDAQFMANFICQQFLTRLFTADSLESIAKIVHSAKPDSPGYLHLYDRSVMLAWLTGHPILAQYQARWPELRKELLNDNGEITKLGHDIDVMLEAIAVEERNC